MLHTLKRDPTPGGPGSIGDPAHAKCQLLAVRRVRTSVRALEERDEADLPEDPVGGRMTGDPWYLLLAFPPGEAAPERLAELDHWLARRGQRALRRVDFGPVAPDGAHVFSTAMRDLRIRDLLDLLEGMPWAAREDVQVLIREPGEVRWAVVPLGG